MSWTALDTVEAAAGASFLDFQGIRLPRRFAASEHEWQAARCGVGLFDARHRRVLSLVGNDRIPFLQGQLTNDVSKLGDGAGCYAVLLTIQGRVVSDLYVYVGSDCVWLDVPANRAEAVRAALERFIIADDVEFQDADVAALLSIEGPHASDLLATIADPIVSPGVYRHHELTIDGISVRCAAVSQTGEIGYRLFGACTAAASLWQRLQAGGAKPVGFDTLDVLRLEAGIPWHGVDMDEETLVMEVGIDEAISFAKGCYLGQEVVERVAARGHVNRKLCGLIASGSLVPPPNTPLAYQGQNVGHITSAAMSPALGKPIALGYLHRSAFEVGTVVQASVSGALLEFTVARRPFYQSMTTHGVDEQEATNGKPTGQTVPV